MNLTELQSELRSIGKRLNELEAEVERMKPKPDGERANEYKVMTELALRHPLAREALAQAGESARIMYIRLLAGIALSEEGFSQERLLYITRIAAGLDQREASAERIVELGAKFDWKDTENFRADLEPVRESFLLDAFTVVNICGKASDKELAMLAELAALFGCDREEAEVLAAVSRGTLTDDFDGLDTLRCVVSNRWCGKFCSFIPEQWLAERRTFCGALCLINGFVENDFSSSATRKCDVKSQIETGKYVNRGEMLVSYVEEKNEILKIFDKSSGNQQENIEKIVAPRDGIVYFIKVQAKNSKTNKREMFLAVYVASVFDSYEALHKWCKLQDLVRLLKSSGKGE